MEIFVIGFDIRIFLYQQVVFSLKDCPISVIFVLCCACVFHSLLSPDV